jgi:mannosyltransferase
VGLSLRLVALERHGLWYDEGFSVLMVELADPTIWRLDLHPPLYYALLWAWSRLSMGDVWLRSLSVVFGVATLPLVFALGARLFSREAGAWAAAFLALLHMHVWYSREARMYALMVLLFTAAFLGLVMAVQRDRRGWILYATATAALTMSQALGIVYALLLAGLFWILAPEPLRRSGWRSWAAASAAGLLPFACWLPFYVSRVNRVVAGWWATLESPWPPLLETLRVFAVAPIPNLSEVLGPSLGIETGYRLWRWIWLVPILGALVVAILGPRPPTRRAAVALLAAYAGPIVGLTAVSLLVHPILIWRVLLPTAVPLALLLGASTEAFPPRRRWHRAGAGALAAVLAVGSFCGLLYSVGPHQEWREASRYLQQDAAPTDVLFFLVGGLHRDDPETARADLLGRTTQLLLRRYDPAHRLAGLRQIRLREAAGECGDEVSACLDRSLGPIPPGRVIWVIRAYDRPLRPVREWLSARTTLMGTRTFEGLVIERRVRRADAGERAGSARAVAMLSSGTR